MPLLNTASKMYAGSQPAKKVYLGSTLVWQDWTPASFSGLAIWFDAKDYNGSTWTNKGSGSQPVFFGTPLPTVSSNTLNGLPVVRFTTNQGRLRITNCGVDLAHTLVYVSRMMGPTAGRVVCAAYPPPNFLIGWWNGKMDVAYSTTGSFFQPDVQKAWDSEGTPTPWILYSSDAYAPPNYYPRMLRNGVLKSSGGTTGGGGANDGFSGTFNISGYGPTGAEESCDCEVAEVLVYNRKLSDADRQQVEGYLRAKWGLS